MWASAFGGIQNAATSCHKQYYTNVGVSSCSIFGELLNPSFSRSRPWRSISLSCFLFLDIGLLRVLFTETEGFYSIIVSKKWQFFFNGACGTRQIQHFLRTARARMLVSELMRLAVFRCMQVLQHKQCFVGTCFSKAITHEVHPASFSHSSLLEDGSAKYLK